MAGVGREGSEAFLADGQAGFALGALVKSILGPSLAEVVQAAAVPQRV